MPLNYRAARGCALNAEFESMYHPFQNKEAQVMNEWTSACVHHFISVGKASLAHVHASYVYKSR